MTSRKRLHLKWAKELLEWLYRHDIVYCEWPECTSTFGIAPAHRLPRFDIHDREEYFMAAYLCQPHHKYVDQGDRDTPGTRERQYALITEIVENRDTNLY